MAQRDNYDSMGIKIRKDAIRGWRGEIKTVYIYIYMCVHTPFLIYTLAREQHDSTGISSPRRGITSTRAF